MILFHGYPQHEDAHPGRPWWHKNCGGWGSPPGGRYVGAVSGGVGPDYKEWWRSDGVFDILVDSDVTMQLARIDREHPMPVPPPLVGQVWHFPSLHRTCLVDGGRWPLEFELASCRGGGPASPWPPIGAVLVYGPLSPWAPSDYEEKP